MLKLVSYVIRFFWFPMLLDKPVNNLLRESLTLSQFIHYPLTGLISLFLIYIPSMLYGGLHDIISWASRREKVVWEYLHAYPNIFCSKHLTKPERIKIMFYRNLYCLGEGCELKTGINQIVGVIGGNIMNYDIVPSLASLGRERGGKR